MADYTTFINRIENRYNPDCLKEIRGNNIKRFLWTKPSSFIIDHTL